MEYVNSSHMHFLELEAKLMQTTNFRPSILKLPTQFHLTFVDSHNFRQDDIS